MIKKFFIRIAFVLFNFGLIYILWRIGWKALAGFGVGVFVGACIIIYWELSRNSWLSGIILDITKTKEDDEDDKI